MEVLTLKTHSSIPRMVYTMSVVCTGCFNHISHIPFRVCSESGFITKLDFPLIAVLRTDVLFNNISGDVPMEKLEKNGADWIQLTSEQSSLAKPNSGNFFLHNWKKVINSSKE